MNGAVPVRWRWRPDADLVGDPVPAGDALVVCDRAHQVHALDLATGRPRWSWRAGGPIVAPVAVAGDRVYAGGPRSAVSALDLATGTVCWQVDHRGDSYERKHPGATSTPAVAGDLLAYRTAWGMHGLDRDTGASRWWAELFSEAGDQEVVPHDGLLLATRAAHDNGNVMEGSLVAIAPADGSTVWEYQDEEVADDCYRWCVVPSNPLVAGGRVSVLEANQFRSFGMEDGDPDQPFLVTVDAATGQPVGRIALPGLFAEMVAPPVLAAGEVWLPQTDALLVADHATGRLRARVDLPAPPVGPPLLAGGRLLQLTADHTVQIVDPATGTPQRRLTVAEGEPAGSGRLTTGDGWLAVQHGGALTLVNAE